METADNSMDVLDARDGLRLPDCVDDAAMAGLKTEQVKRLKDLELRE